MFRTTDGGINWNILNLGVTKNLSQVKFVNTNIGWIVGEAGTLLFTTNSGLNWNSINTLTDLDLYSVYFKSSTLGWICGESGLIIKTTNCGGLVEVNRNEIHIPKSFSLFQNYPNPFNPTTRIKYDVPKNSFVKLIVYDLLGREAATLVNEKQNPGTYEAKWDVTGGGSNYASGIYFYTLSATDGTESFSQTKKMILLK